MSNLLEILDSSDLNKVRQAIADGAQLELPDDKKDTPLHHAIQLQKEDIALFLIESGANVSHKNIYWETPLHLAAQFGLLEVVRLLIEKGADVNAPDLQKKIPLHAAAESREYVPEEVVALLIEEGADLNFQDKQGQTALHVVSTGRNLKIARLLLEKGAKIDSVDGEDNTPLHQAITLFAKNIAHLLIEKGADINLQNLQGETPLHIATRFPPNMTETAKRLIDKGANIHLLTQDNRKAALHVACTSRNTAIAELLLTSGAQINQADSNGNTPLHRAVTITHETGIIRLDKKLVSLLLQHNADLAQKNDADKNPRETALEEKQQNPLYAGGYSEIISMFVSAEKSISQTGDTLSEPTSKNLKMSP